MNDALPNDLNGALQTVIVIVSFFVPAITDFLTARGATGAVKQAIAGGISLVVAVVAVLISGHLDTTNLLAGVALAVTAAKVAYEAFKHITDPLQDVGPQLGAAKTAPAPSGDTSQV